MSDGSKTLDFWGFQKKGKREENAFRIQGHSKMIGSGDTVVGPTWRKASTMAFSLGTGRRTRSLTAAGAGVGVRLLSKGDLIPTR